MFLFVWVALSFVSVVRPLQWFHVASVFPGGVGISRGPLRRIRVFCIDWCWFWSLGFGKGISGGGKSTPPRRFTIRGRTGVEAGNLGIGVSTRRFQRGGDGYTPRPSWAD